MISLNFYSDAALSTPLGSTISVDHDVNASTDVLFYVGSTASGSTFEASSNPGVAQISISVTGAGSEGTGSVKLALSPAGLDSATGGAAIDIGTSIDGGSANAVPVYARITDTVGIAGTYAGINLATNTVREVV